MECAEDIAARIASELASMARGAKAARLDTLHYLIEMARLEAEQAAASRRL